MAASNIQPTAGPATTGGSVSNLTTTPGYGAPFLQPLGQKIGNQLAGVLCQPTNLAGIMPQIAGQNILQQAGAQTVANQAGLGNLQFNPQGQLTGATCGSGVAGYQQYLCAAQQNVGPNAYQQYMSPYQQQVIAPTLQQYDIQSQINRQALPAAAIQAGAYGGARCGVEQGVYQSQSDLNRAVLQAQLQQQGFNQAQQAANTAFGQYNTLGTQQQGYASNLANLLNTYGSTQQGYVQSILGAQQQGNKLAICYPLQQLQTAGGIFTQLTGTPGTPGAPVLTNPALVGAQAAQNAFSGSGSTVNNYGGNASSGGGGGGGGGCGCLFSQAIPIIGCILGSFFAKGGHVQSARVRPMFRRGGSVADGTGITSGLTNRRANYEDGANQFGTQQLDLSSDTSADQYRLNNIPGGITQGLNVPPSVIQAYFKDIKNQIMPTPQQNRRDFLQAFGASAADSSPLVKQTLGQALGKASETLQAENFKREQEANKYAAEGALAGLRGISKQQNEVNMLKARNLASNQLWHPEITDPNQRLNKAYLEAISPSINPYKKDISPSAIIREQAGKIEKTTGAPNVPATTLASFNEWANAHKDNEFVKNLDPNSYDLTGTKLVKGSDAQKFVVSKQFKGNPDKQFSVGNTYVQGTDIYRYDGNGQFTHVYNTNK